jgi:hypothetical protein
MHSACSIHPKISCLFDNNLSPLRRGRSQLEALYLKTGIVEIFFEGGDAFPRVKLAKISHLFDNYLSPGVAGAPSQ